MAIGISDSLAEKQGIGKRTQQSDVHVMIGVKPSTTTEIITEGTKVTASNDLTVTAVADNKVTVKGLVMADLPGIVKGCRLHFEGFPAYPTGLWGDVLSAAQPVGGAANAREVVLVNPSNVYGQRWPDGKAAQVATADVDLYGIAFVALPREVSSGLTFDTRTTTIEEKPPYAEDRPVIGIDTEERVAQSWELNVTANEASGGNAMLNQLMDRALGDKDATVAVRLVKNEKFRGWYGVAEVRIESSPADSGSEGVASTALVLAGRSYMFRCDDVE